jgi:ABC-type Fe3+/spermidine/putrescine transport system ATPase subunit
MQRGRIAQIGTPRALYETPTNAFVAEFIGDSNLLPVRIIEAAGGGCAVKIDNGPVIRALPGQLAFSANGRAFLLLRPEDMTIELQSASPAQDHEWLEGTITELSFYGDVFKLGIAVGGEILKAKVAREEAGGFAVGRQVFVRWKRDAARLLPATTEDPAAAVATP